MDNGRLLLSCCLLKPEKYGGLVFFPAMRKELSVTANKCETQFLVMEKS